MRNGEFAGTFLGLLKPYPLLVGVTTVALFMMHGAIYGVMKTEGELHDKLRRWAMNCIIFFVICAATHDDGHAAVRAAHGRARAG